MRTITFRPTLPITVRTLSLLLAGCLAFGCSPAESESTSQDDPTATAGQENPADGTDPVVEDPEKDPVEDPVTDPDDPVEDPIADPQPGCAPGTVQCSEDGLRVVACKGDGLSWYDVETCEGGDSCDPNTATCGAGCAPSCAAKQCGPDGCGGTCGTCPGTAICTEFGQCGTTDLCVAAGTGIHMGDQVKEITWDDTTGGQTSLHQFCYQTPAVIVMETAVWCSACTALAPTAKKAFEFYGSHGVRTVIAVGEDGGFGPSTTTVASQYQNQHGYTDSMISVVNDPHWVKLHAAITHGGDWTNFLPTFIVLDHKMNIRLTEGSFTEAMAVLSDITGQTFTE